MYGRTLQSTYPGETLSSSFKKGPGKVKMMVCDPSLLEMLRIVIQIAGIIHRQNLDEMSWRFA
jgi:hypothetical protein